MFTDEHRRIVWEQVRQRDVRQFARFLPAARLQEAATRAGVRLGAGPLNLVTLAWLAMASALHTSLNFTGVLVETLKLLHDAGQWRGPGSPSLLPAGSGPGPRGTRSGGRAGRLAERRRHDPRGSDPNLVSEEAFAQARQGVPLSFWEALLEVLGQYFEQEHGPRLRWHGYRLLALDGTEIQLPGWRALGEHFGRAANGRGRGRPQARMVLLQFPLTRLPWRYELTPRTQGERTVAARLLEYLHPRDLVLMDRGFFSYGLFWQVQARQAYFAIRLMAGVKLHTLRGLGDRDRLVRWTPADRQWQRRGLPPALTLRVIDYQIPGFRPSAIVTNVLDPQAISRAQWVRLSTASDPGRRLDPGLYHRRWEIETTFWELKVQQGLEGGLRSRTPAGIHYEVAGQMLLYLLTRWLLVEAAQRAHLDPLRLSFTEARREILALLPLLRLSDATRVQAVLLPVLLQRIARHQVPWRPGRHDPRPHDRKIKHLGRHKVRLPSRLLPHEA